MARPTYLLQNPKTGDVVAYFSLLNDTNNRTGCHFLIVDALNRPE